MNLLISQTEHNFFTKQPVSKFKIEIDNLIITIWSEKNILTTQIEGTESIESMDSLHLDILSLYFLCLGSFPKIISLEINNIFQEVSELPNGFNTSTYFRRKVSVISDIDSKSISKDTIYSLRQMNTHALSSFQFLLSDTYHDVIQIHKLTLLLHTIDGFISDDDAESVEDEIKELWKLKKDDIVGDYKAKIYFLCKILYLDTMT